MRYWIAPFSPNANSRFTHFNIVAYVYQRFFNCLKVNKSEHSMKRRIEITPDPVIKTPSVKRYAWWISKLSDHNALAMESWLITWMNLSCFDGSAVTALFEISLFNSCVCPDTKSAQKVVSKSTGKNIVTRIISNSSLTCSTNQFIV